MNKRFKLNQQMKHADDDATKEALEKAVKEVEKELAESVSKEKFEKVRENFSLLSNDQESFSINGMWKVQNKVFPKHTKPLPVAKLDNN